MNLEQIKNAVDNGLNVCWQNSSYAVIKDTKNQYWIKCENNDSLIGLTWADNVTLSGKESDFFILWSV